MDTLSTTNQTNIYRISVKQMLTRSTFPRPYVLEPQGHRNQSTLALLQMDVKLELRLGSMPGPRRICINLELPTRLPSNENYSLVLTIEQLLSSHFA